ncbi:MAG: discoidin domain-containing protein [Planctomycetaceae bacterium]|nr:discoidin domain-containing protein [Planctomycetaceae bacterium]
MQFFRFWTFLLFLFFTGFFQAASAEPPFSRERLLTDWIYQDHSLNTAECFSNSDNSLVEQKMLEKVFLELSPEQSEPLQEEKERLLAAKVPGNDPRWKSLYLQACQIRRLNRLAPLVQKFPNIVYTKHSVLGGSHYAYTEEPTDAQMPERNHDFQPGGQICLLTLNADGTLSSKMLYETQTGFLRDPDVSYDGKRILFSMRNNMETDDFHIYEYDCETQAVRQLTDGLGFADIEPCYLPDGNILFTSTRCMQIVDCFWTDVSNFYMIDKDGHFLRRIGFDQVHTNYPKVLEDGRITYTRWDYNDRGQIFPQPLYVMNYDGTGQTEFYGNNSYFPTTIAHARGIPDSPKVVAIATGHHSHQRGKLILIDRTKGTQENSGVQLICPPRETPAVRIDIYGQDGEQFQYPYPLDENLYIVAYVPEGLTWGKYEHKFGLYLMDIEGNRELLVHDPAISSGQAVPLISREIPQLRASAVDYRKTTGTYYVQDVYVGQGMENIERGTIKSLRIVALEFRAAGIGSGRNSGPAGGALVSTPAAYNNGAWGVKHVLGTVPIEEDGSAYFEVPARTPVYFQLLDENGYVIQTMRSWSTLQPGEMFSCIGCHENKTGTLDNVKPTVRQALKKRPRKPEPLFGPDRPADAGFSFMRDVQPILDTHCVGCHTGQTDAPFSLLGNSYIPKDQKENDSFQQIGRDFSEAYLNLIQKGQSNEIVNWLGIQEGPPVLPPYHAGAVKSKLLAQFEGENPHNNVRLSKQEKRILACWIDLLVPYCGSYTEANIWTDEQKAEYDYYLNKRKRMEELEAVGISLLVQKKQAEEQIEYGEDPKDVAFPDPSGVPVFDAGGRQRKAEFLAHWPVKRQNVPIYGQKNGVENVYRNLALNPKSEQFGYPQATSNSEFAMRPEFVAQNAIDGKTDNAGHGPQFPSWGPNKRTDLWWKVDFGRPVETDKIVIWIRADFPHDGAWKSATLEFSDGSKEKIVLEKTEKPQTFTFAKRATTFVKITELQEDFPLGWCALTEVEVWGNDRNQ